jgi:hypothetical protein
VPWLVTSREPSIKDVELTGERTRVIRPAAVVPARLALHMLAWLEDNNVSRGGLWLHDTRSIQRFDQPFNGASGMRGDAVLLGSMHLMWDHYDATIFRANLTDAGLGAGLTVDQLCDEVLIPVGLTLASCPRADLVDAPAPDPFRLQRMVPRPAGPSD